MRANSIKYIFILLFVVLTASCKEKTSKTPKPYAYFRINMPENSYQKFDMKDEPYTFEYSQMAQIHKRTDKPEEDWINIVYTKYNATIYLTYRKLKNNLAQTIEDSHHFTYRHTIKADAINEALYAFPQKHMYGLFSKLEGNVASPIQFLLTDSTKNFLRGSLYFNAQPNADSIEPVLDFIEKDIIHLMETAEWKAKR